MGWNTTVVVMNDALDAIERDPEFGRKLGRAAAEIMVLPKGKMADVSALGHCNAASVIETHHADNTAIVTVGGNLGIAHLQTFGWNHHTEEGQVHLLREWADKLGFRLTRKRVAQVTR